MNAVASAGLRQPAVKERNFLMRLEQFQYVIEIVRAHTLSQAARNLFISQPALSNSIQALEKELEFRIFQRSSSGMVLTKKGREFYAIALRIQDEIHNVDRLTNDELHTDTVSIAAVPMACCSMMLDLMHSVQQEMPDLNLKINELRPGKIIPAMTRGRSSIAVCNYVEPLKERFMEQVKKFRLEMDVLLQDSLYVFLPSDSPLAEKEVIYRTDLSGMKSVGFATGAENEIPGMKALIPEMSAASYSFTQHNSIKDAVARGFGYTILPGMMAIDDYYVREGQIRVVPLEEEFLSTIVLLSHQPEYLSVEEKQILEMLHDYGPVMSRRLRMLNAQVCPDQFNGRTE